MPAVVLNAADGLPLAGFRFEPAAAPKGSEVIAPAMAVRQSFYAAFAAWLAGQGFRVWTFDYRGTGASRPGSMRNAPGDLDDWCRKDYDAVLRTALAVLPNEPLLAIGHRFGGQCAPLLPSRHLLAGLVNIAVGSGAMRHNTPAIRRTAPWLWYLLVPLLCPLFDHFPGARRLRQRSLSGAGADLRRRRTAARGRVADDPRRLPAGGGGLPPDSAATVHNAVYWPFRILPADVRDHTLAAGDPVAAANTVISGEADE